MTRLFVLLLIGVMVLFLFPNPAPAADFRVSVGQSIIAGVGDNLYAAGTNWNPTTGTSLYLTMGKTNWIVDVMQTMSLHQETSEALVSTASFSYVFTGEPAQNSWFGGFSGIVSRTPDIAHGGVGGQLGTAIVLGDKSYHTVRLVGRWVDKEGWSVGIEEGLTFDFP